MSSAHCQYSCHFPCCQSSYISMKTNHGVNCAGRMFFPTTSRFLFDFALFSVFFTQWKVTQDMMIEIFCTRVWIQKFQKVRLNLNGNDKKIFTPYHVGALCAHIFSRTSTLDATLASTSGPFHLEKRRKEK